MTRRVLVSRTDGIGDVVLTLPLCGLLKAQAGVAVVMLVRGYTRPVAAASPFVDDVADWDEVAGSPDDQRAFLRAVGADVIVHVFPRRDIARAARAAGIRRRIGTSHRLFHWLTCNQLEHFSRKRSDLHEAQLNVRLARRILPSADLSIEGLIPYGRISAPAAVPRDVAAMLEARRVNVVLHPKSRGHGREWPLERWHELATSLAAMSYGVFVTGSREEGHQLRAWLDRLPPAVTDLTGRLTLEELMAFLARVDGVVAAGTGPLHLSAALGVNALGLFPPTRPIHAGRWAPIGPRADYVIAPLCPACAAGRRDCSCMEGITVDAVRARVAAWSARTR